MVVMLHGEHNTCGDNAFPRNDHDNSYVLTGDCSDPAYPVEAPSHLGYAYLAERLASFGYVVISINSNLGINHAPGLMDDFALTLARGRLVLAHLEQWLEWSDIGGVPNGVAMDPDAFVGKLDFAEVGLFGHSRGGEGVRAAQTQYLEMGSPWPAKIPGLTIQAIYEAAPTNYQELIPLGVPWHVSIGTCDQDVDEGSGAGVFASTFGSFWEPTFSPKSLWWVHGANHNFFNTQWQVEEMSAQYCDEDYSATPPLFVDGSGGSLSQQYTMVSSVIPFFRQHVGTPAPFIEHKGFANPLWELDQTLVATARVDREFLPSPGQSAVYVLDDFDDMDQMGLHGQPFVTNGVQIQEEWFSQNSGFNVPRARVTWQNGGPTTTLDLLFAAGGNGEDLSAYQTLDFRVARTESQLNAAPTTSFSVQLLGPGGQVSAPISTAAAVDLVGPYHMVVTHTVRLRLVDFGMALDKIRGVRFVFDESESGEVWLDDVLFSKAGYAIVGYYPFPGGKLPPPSPSEPLPVPPIYTGTVRHLGYGIGYWSDGTTETVHELEVSSAQPLVDGALPARLAIGEDIIEVSRPCRYSSTGGACTIFQLTESQYQSLTVGDPMFLVYDSPNRPRWDLGLFTTRL